jgi:threonine dehydrogenase-like Zn-dependent dehydrogenase
MNQPAQQQDPPGTARAAILKAAERVIVIDRLPERLAQAADIIGTDTINYASDSVAAELRERTGGRGPDVCIEAVGMEADSPGPHYLYDQVKQQLRLQTALSPSAKRSAPAARAAASLSSACSAGWWTSSPSAR